MNPEFFPEQTIRYKTTIKRTLVDGLTQVFQRHPDALIHKTRVGIEYPKTKADYPAVVVRLYEREIFNAGVGHEEVISFNGESASTEVVANVAQSGAAIELNWPRIAYATSYNIYHGTSGSGETERFSSLTNTFRDVGNAGTPAAVLANPTASFDPPVVSTLVIPGAGTRPAGDHFYRVTAIGPSTAVKFKHYFYTADIEFAVYALSSLDRDLVADTVVQTITMGTLEDWTNTFYERVYPNTDIFPDSQWNFININADRIQGFGETQMQTPWGAEDDLMYMTSYRFGVFGEIYSLPPDLTYEMIGQVLAYPYIDGVEAQPQGVPGAGPWISN